MMLILAPAAARSQSTLEYSVENLGGGLFQYNFTLQDTFDQPLSGLNLFYGNSVFGLDDNSVISAPGGWGYFAPLPPTVNELNFFSLSAASDVPMGGALGDFSFQSTTDPATLTPGDLAFDVIGGITGTQIPEPATGSLVALGALVLLIKGALQHCSNRKPGV